MKYTFSGPTEQVYPQYLDLGDEDVHTLHAKPGETYDIGPAEGHPDGLAMPPDDRWTKANTSKKETG